MKKKILIVTILVAIGMLSQAFFDHLRVHKQDVVIATMSFASGCLIQGRDQCFEMFSTNEDRDVLFRGSCLDSTYDDCQKKSAQYGAWFDAGARK